MVLGNSFMISLRNDTTWSMATSFVFLFKKSISLMMNESELTVTVLMTSTRYSRTGGWNVDASEE
jgi:hypothetical protein